MHIGMRTIKTVVGATAALALASSLDLQFWPVAGLILILTVQGTTKTSLRLVAARLIATVIAFALAFVSFQVVGFNALAFGLILLVYIPIVNALRLHDGVLVSAMLCATLLSGGSVSLKALGNAAGLFVIGSGIGLFLNLFMPDLSERITNYQSRVQAALEAVLTGLAAQMDQAHEAADSWSNIAELDLAIQAGQKWTVQHGENQLLGENDYYRAFFAMRAHQLALLSQMQGVLDEAEQPLVKGAALKQALGLSAAALNESTPPAQLIQMVKRLRRDVTEMPLPATQDEFEARSRALLFINDLSKILNYKRNFVQVVAQQN